ncbi:MAG: exodeoxyribonuclease VII large subunit, partial [Pseudomonadota bacterium]
DILIVGRGGGSIEDLWPFNEEAVVRAAFESDIPLISAVGHETDTTLIDYVSDARAPTPTGAAEIAVPVRSELQLQVSELDQRVKRALTRQTRRGRERLIATRLPRPERLLESKRQRLDTSVERLPRAALTLVERRRGQLNAAAAKLISPKQIVQAKAGRLETLKERLNANLQNAVARKQVQFSGIASRLRPEPLQADTKRARQALTQSAIRARPAVKRLLDGKHSQLASEAKLLETLSYQATLGRGYAIVRDETGKVLRSKKSIASGAALNLTLSDGDLGVIARDGAPPPKKAKVSNTGSKLKPDSKQARLL